jgi:trk system potassium uptake protein TrkH
MDFQSLKNISKFISAIGISISLFFLIPLFTGLYYHDNIKNFLIFDISFFIINFIIFLFLLNHHIKMTIKESILIVNLVWILLGIIGAISLCLTSNINFYDGFFEAISGFTTTGATIYNNIENLSHTTLMLRSLMNWLGGVGIVVLSVGLLPFINPSGSLTLFKAESTGIKMDKLTPKIKDTALRVWGIYFILTFVDMVLLHIEGMNFFDAINHSFTTISTGGFSTKNSSIGYWDNNTLIIWTTTIFMLLSGMNFIAHLKLFFYKNASDYKIEEIKWYIIIFTILSLSLTLIHFFHSHDTFFYSLTHSCFTISSILTTTGYDSVDYGKWCTAATAIIFIAMFSGGTTGSTAGGMKVIRYIVLFKNLHIQIKKILHPNAIIDIYIDKTKITNSILNNISGFFLLFIFTNLGLSLFLYAQGYDFLTAFSASIACIGNIGPGFSLVGPAQNFSFFNPTDKIVLAIFMIIGRLEFYTFIILFSKEFWKKF